MTVSVVGNFCITATNETMAPTGGITCSALGGAVNRHLLRPRLTSARSSRRLSTLGSTVANVQISQGNSRDLPAYACRIYVTAFRASIGLWRFVPPHPVVPPLSASCSSGQHFASGFLQIRSHPRHPCLWLTLPLAGCVEDFHLQVTSVATTAKLVALARNAPCLAHPKKSPASAGLFPSAHLLFGKHRIVKHFAQLALGEVQHHVDSAVERAINHVLIQHPADLRLFNQRTHALVGL